MAEEMDKILSIDELANAVSIPKISAPTNVAPAGPSVGTSAPAVQGLTTLDETQKFFEENPEPPVPKPGLVTALGGGFGRGLGQIEAALPTLEGTFKEATGDLAGASDAAARAKAVEQKTQAAHPAYVPSIADIKSPEDFAYWLTEKLGEQGPNLAGMVASGGAGSLIANLAGRGMALSASSLAALSRYGAVTGTTAFNVGLETADTAGELREATGSFQPGVSLTAGIVKGALESYAPLKFMKELDTIPVKSFGGLAGYVGKTSLREGFTEGLQEVVNVGARKFADPEYQLGWDTALRIADAAAAGAAVGSVYGGAGKMISQRLKFAEDTGEREDYTAGPVNELKRTQAKPLDRADSGVTSNPTPKSKFEDAFDATGIFEQFKLDWSATTAKPEAIGQFEEARTKRYVFADEQNKPTSRVLNDTGVEFERAMREPASQRAQVFEVDQRELEPHRITAEEWDLPDRSTDNRIWFLPEVTPAKQAELLQKFDRLAQDLANNSGAVQKDLTTFKTIENSLKAKYVELLKEGLRVIPSYGASFHYNGDLKVRKVELNTSQRSQHTYAGPNMASIVYDQSGVVKATPRKAVDLNKFREGEYSAIPNLKNFYKDIVRFSPAVAKDARTKLLNEIENLWDEARNAGLSTLQTKDVQALMKKGVWFDPMSGKDMIFSRDLRRQDFVRGTSIAANDSDMSPHQLARLTVDIPNKPAEPATLTVESAPIKTKTATEMERIAREAAPFVQKLLRKMNIRGKVVIKIGAGDGGSPGAMFVSGRTATLYLEPNSYDSFSTTFGYEYYRYGANFDALMWNLIMHEIGHYITLYHWSQTPLTVKQEVFYDYNLAMLNATMYDLSVAGSRTFPTGNPDVTFPASQARYYRTFVEYLTEQFRRAATQDVSVRADVNQFFTKVGRQLTQLIKDVETKKGKLVRTNMFSPAAGFTKFYEYMQSMLDPQLKYYDLVKSRPGFNLDFDITSFGPELHGKIDQIIEVVGRYLPYIPKTVNVSIKSALSVPSSSASDLYQTDDGHFLNLALLSLLSRSGTPHPHVFTEVIRVLDNMGLFTPEERAILVRASSKLKPLVGTEVMVSLAAEKLYPGNPALQAEFTKRELEQLKIAQLFTDRMNGQAIPAETMSLLDRVKDVLEKIVNYLRSEGWTSHRHIMAAVWRGEVTARAEQAEREQSIIDTIKEATASGDPATINQLAQLMRETGAIRVDALGIKDPHPGKVIAFHGTSFDFDKFDADRSALGVHFGSPEQAQHFAVSDEKFSGRVYPVILDVKNPITLPDMATWPISDTVEEIARLHPEAKAQLASILQTASDVKTGHKMIRAVLEQLGYDSVRYWNKFEANEQPGWSYIAWKPGTIVSATSGLTLNAVQVGRSRNRFLTPEAIVKLDDNLYVAKELVRKGEQILQAHYRFYAAPTGELTGNLQRDHDLLGEERGYVLMTRKDSRGMEVDMIQAYNGAKFGRQSSTFYAFIEKDIGQKIKPSGYLLPDGYRMWQRRDPSMVKYHVEKKDKDDDSVYVSPRYVQERIKYYEMIRRQVKRDPKGSIYKIENVEEQLKIWKDLYKKIPEKAWSDPRLPDMFMVQRDSVLQTINDKEMGKEEAAGIGSIIGREMEGDSTYHSIYKDQAFESQQLNAQRAGVPFEQGAPAQAETQMAFRIIERIFPTGERNPQVRRRLQNPNLRLATEADRVTWFSKLFFSLQQLQFRNQGIVQLERYMQLVDAWRQRVNYWNSRADDVARDWEQLSAQRREAMAQLLFWLTEMRYRSPAEVNNRVVRFPTQAELAAQFRALRLTRREVTIFNNINASFQDYLRDVERVSAQNIRRTFAANPQGLQNAMAQLQAEMAALRSRPYFPMVRFGQFTITVRDPSANNRVTHFSAYATVRERDRAVEQVSAQFRGMDVTISRLPEEMMEFMGLPPTILRMIRATMPGLTGAQNQWLEEFEFLMAPERSFRKRWMTREGTHGYSLDAFRAYAHYFLHGANYLAKLEYRDQLQEQVTSVRDEIRTTFRDGTKRNQIADYMQAHLNYITEPGKDWAKLKSFTALWQLGFSVAAAGINLTQIVTNTAPYLAGTFGAVKGNRAVMNALSALKGMLGGRVTAPGSYGLAHQEMVRQGRIDIGQAAELGAYAEGSNLVGLLAGSRAQKAMRQTSYWAMSMFQQIERYNREVTFLAAWRLAHENPNNPAVQAIGNSVVQLTEINDLVARLGAAGFTTQDAVAFIFAKQTIDRTQFNYDRFDRPAYMRQPLVNALLIFQLYTQNMIYALRFNPGQVQMLLTLLVLYGVSGMPGAEDLDKWVKAIARRLFGENFSPLDKAKEMVISLTKDTMFETTGGDLFLKGISRYGFGLGLLPEGFGLPRFDASTNGSMGKVIPFGLGADTARVIADYGKAADVVNAAAERGAGAGFGLMFPLLKFMMAPPGSSEWQKWETLLPRFAKAASKAGRYVAEGEVKTRQGGTFYKWDLTDPDHLSTIAAQAIGFAPTAVNQKWDMVRDVQSEVKWWTARKAILYAQFDRAVQEKDSSLKEHIRERIRQFNAEAQRDGVPSMGITADSLIKSMEQRARARALQTQDLPAQRSQIPVSRRVKENYPEVIDQKKVR